MEHHYCPGYNLEQILDTIDDPTDRARIIDEAYSFIGKQALEAVVVESEAA